MFNLLKSDDSQATRPYWMIWAGIFAFSVLTIAVKIGDEDQKLILYGFPPLLLILIAVGFGRKPASGRPTRGWWLPLIPLSMLMIWYAFIRIFGYFSLAPILFHFQYDMESNGVVSSVPSRCFWNSCHSFWCSYAGARPRVAIAGWRPLAVC